MQPKEVGFINGGSSKRDSSMPYPMFYVDVDDIDFVNNPEDLGNIINRIDAELNGLF